MAHKRNVRLVVSKLLRGEIDFNSKLGIEILQEITERVLRERPPHGSKGSIYKRKLFASDAPDLTVQARGKL